MMHLSKETLSKYNKGTLLLNVGNMVLPTEQAPEFIKFSKRNRK